MEPKTVVRGDAAGRKRVRSSKYREPESSSHDDSKVYGRIEAQQSTGCVEKRDGGNRPSKLPKLRREVSLVGKDAGFEAFDPLVLGPRSKSLPEGENIPTLIRDRSITDYDYGANGEEDRFHEDGILPEDFRADFRPSDDFQPASSIPPPGSPNGVGDLKMPTERPTMVRTRSLEPPKEALPSGSTKECFPEKKVPKPPPRVPAPDKTISSTSERRNVKQESTADDASSVNSSSIQSHASNEKVSKETRRRSAQAPPQIPRRSLRRTSSRKPTNVERMDSESSIRSCASAGSSAIKALSALGIPILQPTEGSKLLDDDED